MLKRIAVLTLPLLACVDADGGAGGDIDLLGVEPPAEVRLDGSDTRNALFGVLEYGTGWDHDWIEVCWDESAYSADPANEQLMAVARDWVQNVVMWEWGRVSRLRFIGAWSSCASTGTTADIRIGHDDLDGWAVQGTEARQIASGPTMAINLLGPASSGCVPGNPPPDGGGYIPACNGTLLGADPDSRENWTKALALHLFGYALGLRKEDVHPEGTPCPGVSETIDGWGDGEALWGFDTASVMSVCKLTSLAYGEVLPTLSVGDIRSINSLYPGVVRLFPITNLGGESWPLGLGYYDRTTRPELADVSSIIVPPGYRVTVCNMGGGCSLWTTSKRTLTASWDNQIKSVSITAQGFVARDKGFIGAGQWLSSGTYKASQGQLNVVGNNAISSAWVAPGQAVTLCDSETPSPASCITAVGGTLGVPALVKLPGAPVNQNTFAGWNMDDVASYVRVQPRVVTYASQYFYDAMSSLSEGVYTVSGGSTYLASVRALVVPAGLEAIACNGENPYSFPRPTCQTLVQSGALMASLQGNVKRLEVRVPMVVAP